MEFTSLTPMVHLALFFHFSAYFFLFCVNFCQILKGLMLHYQSCQNLLSFHLVLYLKVSTLVGIIAYVHSLQCGSSLYF